MGPTIKANCTSQMEAAIAALSGELSKLRTGRASAGDLLTLCIFIFLPPFILGFENNLLFLG